MGWSRRLSSRLLGSDAIGFRLAMKLASGADGGGAAVCRSVGGEQWPSGRFAMLFPCNDAGAGRPSILRQGVGRGKNMQIIKR